MRRQVAVDVGRRPGDVARVGILGPVEDRPDMLVGEGAEARLILDRVGAGYRHVIEVEHRSRVDLTPGDAFLDGLRDFARRFLRSFNKNGIVDPNAAASEPVEHVPPHLTPLRPPLLRGLELDRKSTSLYSS